MNAHRPKALSAVSDDDGQDPELDLSIAPVAGGPALHDRPSGSRPVVRRKTTYSVTEAAELLGIHRETAYLQIAAGTFPVPVIRVGRQMKIPRAVLDELLGLTES